MKKVYYELTDIDEFQFPQLKKRFFKGLVYLNIKELSGYFLFKSKQTSVFLRNSSFVFFIPKEFPSAYKTDIDFLEIIQKNMKLYNVNFNVCFLESSSLEKYSADMRNKLKDIPSDSRYIILDYGLQIFLQEKNDDILKIISRISVKYNFIFNYTGKPLNIIGIEKIFFDFILSSKFVLKKIYKRTLLAIDVSIKGRSRILGQMLMMNITFSLISNGLFLVIFNKDKRIVFMNPYTLRETGYTLDEIFGKAWCDIYIVPEDKLMIQNVCDSVMMEQKQYLNFKSRIQIKDGDILFVEWINSIIYSSSGEVLGVFSLGVNKTAEQSLFEQTRATLSNYEFLLKYFKIIFYRMEYDTVKNKADIVFFDEPQSIIPDFFQQSLSVRTLRKKIEQNIDLHKKSAQTFSIEIKRNDQNLYLQNNLIFLKEDEHTQLYSGLLINESEKIQNEKELQLLYKAVNSLFEYMVITDKKGNIIFVNNTFEKITLYSREEVLGKNPRILNSGKLPAKYFTNLWNTILSGKSWKGRFVNKRKNGEIYTEEAFISPMLDNKGRITNFIAIKRDITKELALEQDIIQYKKISTLGQFTAGLVHDLNNILTSINGNATLLSLEHPDSEEVKEIKASVQEAHSLLSNLLNFVKKKDIVFETINLKRYFDKLRTLSKGLLTSQIRFIAVEEKDLWDIQFDETLLSEIFLNLISNSVKAIDGQGEIEIQAANYEQKEEEFIPLGKYVLFTVKDTGKGMDHHTMKHIFDPFFTTAKKDFQKGTGLGLSNVYNFVKQAKGYIFVESELGQGTTFKIFFPAVENKNI